MTANKSQWWSAMIKKHGSEEAVREFMRQNQQKSMMNPSRQKGNHQGGFKNNPELAKKMSDKALQKRWGKNHDKVSDDL